MFLRLKSIKIVLFIVELIIIDNYIDLYRFSLFFIDSLLTNHWKIIWIVDLLVFVFFWIFPIILQILGILAGGRCPPDPLP